MKYIFVVGAPGSKWSSVVKNIYFSPDIDRSDYSEDRKYAHHAGVTGAVPVGPVGVYTRVAVGEKYTNGANFAYYSVEPGVTYTIGQATAKVGYRYRTAMVDPNVNKDTTDTVRVGLAFEVTKKDTIGIRYDRVRGDSFNHSYNLAYTRSF